MQPDSFTVAEIRQTPPLELLKLLGGWYLCPKGDHGQRLGPLVGYAGKYDAGNGEMMQYVGDVYANFAKAEEQPRVIRVWSEMMLDSLEPLKPTVVLGMPWGGLASSVIWALSLGCRFGFAEKKTVRMATDKLREQSLLALNRHTLREGDRVLLGEDVTNNLSTAREACELVWAANAEVVGIVCWLNRSPAPFYFYSPSKEIPIVSLVFQNLPEYKQEDPYVAGDVALGNIELKPKDKASWANLMAAMQQYSL